MKFVTKIFILITIIFFSKTVYASSNNSDFKIVAKVNNEVITKYDVDNRNRLMLLSIKGRRTKNDNKRIYQQALEQLIEDKIKEQDIAKKNIHLEKNSVKNYITELEKKQKFSKGGLKKYLTQNGVNYNSYLEKIKNDLLWNKLVEDHIQSNITISDYEVNEAVEYIVKNSNRIRFNISEIFIPINARDNKNEIKSFVEGLVKEVRKNNNFEEVAGKFSRSPTAKNAGNIGWLDEKDISKNIFNQIKNLKKGEISEPLFVGSNTNGGYYIFKLNNKKRERIIKEDEMSRVKEVLYNQKLNIAIKKYLEKLRQEAFVEIF